jgi:pyruvate,orthophosphate dikinase
VLKEGDWISINGDTGEIIPGKQALKPPAVEECEIEGDCTDLSQFMSWVDGRRKLRVLANADSAADATEARKNGAQGIGWDFVLAM